MSQGTESWVSEGSSTPVVKPTASWEEISPETLRQAAQSVEGEAAGSEDAIGAVGMAWFEVLLGLLLGITAMIGTWYWSGGALGFFIAVFPVILGVPLVLTKRRDLRYLGYGLLVAIPSALVLGLLLWYLTLFL